MATEAGRPATAAALATAALLALAGCAPPEADGLLALRLEEAPAMENWRHAVPLVLRAGGGNVHEVRGAVVRLDADTDPIHPSSASCHHGPPVTDPVAVELRAFYDDERIYVEIGWEDPTDDRRDRSWRRDGDGWTLDEKESDGVAVIWSRDPRPFGCMQACHVDDWAVRGGSLVDVRSMYLKGEDSREEAWVWKASGHGGALTLGPEGFKTVAGEAYRRPNSAAAEDLSLPAETRRARTFSAGDRPREEASRAADVPAWTWGDGLAEGGLTTSARRTSTGWRVLFSRPREMGEGRQSFRAGTDLPFGIAVFDATATDHHIVRDTWNLRLLDPPRQEEAEGEGEAPSRLGPAPGQVWIIDDDPAMTVHEKDG